jgi:hypothetical protein
MCGWTDLLTLLGCQIIHFLSAFTLFWIQIFLNALTNTNASQFPALYPHSAYSMDCPLPVDDAVPCTVRTSWAWAPCTVARTRQSLTLHRGKNPMLFLGLNSWHAHQLHIAPQGIAQLPNVH